VSHKLESNNIEEHSFDGSVAPWESKSRLQNLNDLRMKSLTLGESLIDFSMINPDLSPNRIFVDKLVQSCLKPHNHHYGVSKGIKKLREAFARKYQKVFSVNIDPSKEICTTFGSKDGLLQVMKACCPKGGRALLIAPVYPTYPALCSYNNISYDVFTADEFNFESIQKLKIKLESNNYDLLLTNFPQNPTGHIVSKNFWSELVSLCRSKKILIVNDFVYAEMVFGSNSAESILSVDTSYSGIVEIYSLSKAYNIPGWRVASLVGDPEIIEKVASIKSYVDYGLFLPLQLAVSQSLDTDEDLVSATRKTYERRAKLLSDGLIKLGWIVSMPRSGASVWAKVPDAYKNLNFHSSFEISESLLTKCSVYSLPGEVFGPNYSQFQRFALVQPEDRIREALIRLESYET